MRKSKRIIKNSKKKKAKIIYKKPNLENQLNQNGKLEEIKTDKKSSQEEFIEDEFEDDNFSFEFRQDFSDLIRNSRRTGNLENIQIENSLEGGVIFAPRLKERDEHGKVYSSDKYQDKYNESHYSEETPGVYSEKKSENGNLNNKERGKQ